MHYKVTVPRRHLTAESRVHMANCPQYTATNAIAGLQQLAPMQQYESLQYLGDNSGYKLVRRVHDTYGQVLIARWCFCVHLPFCRCV